MMLKDLLKDLGVLGEDALKDNLQRLRAERIRVVERGKKRGGRQAKPKSTKVVELLAHLKTLPREEKINVLKGLGLPEELLDEEDDS